MAINESTATANAPEATPKPAEFAFQPVRYSRPEVEHANLPGFPVRRFADSVDTVATGAASILRLIDWDTQRAEDHESDPDAHPVPVLNDFHRGALLRLVAANMDMLAEQADHLMRWAYTQHTAEGKTEELADALRLVKHCERMAKGQRA